MERSNEELCLLIQSGDQQAKQDLCIKNQRLIGKVAAAYVGYNGNDLDIDDLIQVGFLGLLAAAEKYDAGNGAKFSTYAVHWIKRKIKQEIREHGFSIKIPNNLMNTIEKCIKLDTSLMQQGLERDERLLTIADTLDLTVEKVKKCLSIRKQYMQYVSLNSIVDEENHTELEEITPDENAPLPEDEAEKGDLIERLHTVLDELDTQEQEIIKHRYGIDGVETLLYSELSAKYDLSEERIRQIEERALRKMKYRLES